MTDLKKAKDRAWKVFSLYIRTKYADFDGYVTCVTCGATKPIKEMQAGHFIPGRRGLTFFDERNVHPQDSGCNLFKHGNLIPYYEFMVKTYGQGVIEELKELDKVSKSWTVAEYNAIHDHYKNLLSML